LIAEEREAKRIDCFPGNECSYMPKSRRVDPERSPEALRQDLETHQEELVVQHQQLREAQAELEASRDAYATTSPRFPTSRSI
jgi:hypothetical protein